MLSVCLCLYVYRLLQHIRTLNQRMYPTHTYACTHPHSTMQCGPLSWLPWQVDSSLRSEMTQTVFVYWIFSRRRPSHFFPVAFDGNTLLSLCPFPLTLSGSSGDINWHFACHNHTIFYLMNGTSERETKICGCWEEQEGGCIAFLLVRSYKEFAQII